MGTEQKSSVSWCRFIVVGSPGSGKSYFSRELHRLTGLPVVHLDVEYWNPGWVETPGEVWQEKVRLLTQEEEWIMDGNYAGTMEMRFLRADCVVYLRRPRLLCMLRILKRHGKKRPDLPEFLEEKWDRELFEFMRYTWNFYTKNDRNIRALHEKYPATAYVELRTRRQIRAWKQALASART